MAVSGINTGDINQYTDAAALDATLVALALRVEVVGDDQLSEMQSHVTVRAAGTDHVATHDLAAPMPFETRHEKLMKKASGLVGEDKALAL